MESCPECGSKKISWDSSGLVCNKCGSILKESFFSGERIVV